MTVAESIKTRVENLKPLLGELAQHSAIGRHRDDPDSGFVIVRSSPYYWKPLPAPGRQAQARALQAFRALVGTLDCILAKASPVQRGRAKKLRARVAGFINQRLRPMSSDVQAHLTRSTEALDGVVGVVAELYDGASGSHIYVPDTNALLHNPELESWEFPGVARMRIVLVPLVLSELDEQKVNHRNENVRKKAESLIRRIKGYRSRGSLTSGVPLTRDKSELFAIATEPDFGATLSWLDRSSPDDRMIASFIEVMRTHPHSTVTLVTRDINVQNKVEVAALPFTEPPDPK